jgi:type II secretory pathway component PulF
MRTDGRLRMEAIDKQGRCQAGVLWTKSQEELIETLRDG